MKKCFTNVLHMCNIYSILKTIVFILDVNTHSLSLS